MSSECCCQLRGREASHVRCLSTKAILSVNSSRRPRLGEMQRTSAGLSTEAKLQLWNIARDYVSCSVHGVAAVGASSSSDAAPSGGTSLWALTACKVWRSPWIVRQVNLYCLLLVFPAAYIQHVYKTIRRCICWCMWKSWTCMGLNT